MSGSESPLRSWALLPLYYYQFEVLDCRRQSEYTATIAVRFRLGILYDGLLQLYGAVRFVLLGHSSYYIGLV